MSSANIAATFVWSISASPGDSDYCHIVLSYEEERNDANQQNTTVWKVKSVLWDLYKTSSACDNIPIDVGDDGGEGLA